MDALVILLAGAGILIYVAGKKSTKTGADEYKVIREQNQQIMDPAGYAVYTTGSKKGYPVNNAKAAEAVGRYFPNNLIEQLKIYPFMQVSSGEAFVYKASSSEIILFWPTQFISTLALEYVASTGETCFVSSYDPIVDHVWKYAPKVYKSYLMTAKEQVYQSESNSTAFAKFAKESAQAVGKMIMDWLKSSSKGKSANTGSSDLSSEDDWGSLLPVEGIAEGTSEVGEAVGDIGEYTEGWVDDGSTEVEEIDATGSSDSDFSDGGMDSGW